MNDTQLRSRLQELTDPPLAPRPSRSELEERIARRSRRRRVVMAAAAAFVLVVAGAFAVSGWPWSRAPGHVQVEDPTPAQSDTSQPSDKHPSEMTDEELAAELDRILRSGEQIADGVHYYFGLGAELLGGDGDPRGADSWWSQQSYATPTELADAIDEYVADGLVRNEQLDVPGYLEGEDRTVALLREVADRLRDMPPPQRPPYPYQGNIGEGRVPVPEMAGHGSQRLADVVALGEFVAAVGNIGEWTPGARPTTRPAVLLSADHGASWELVDVAAQGMTNWEITSAATDGQRVVVGGAIDDGTATSRPAVAVSDDGRTWHPLQFPDGASGQIRDVTITSDGMLVAVGWQMDPFGPAIWTSQDLRTLGRAELPTDEPGRLQGVAAGPRGVIAIASEERDGHPRLWHSDDAISWRVAPASDLGVTGEQLTLRGVRYLDEYAGGSYVITGDSAGGVIQIWTSSNEEDWQQIDLETGDDAVAGLVFDVNVDTAGRLVAVGGLRYPGDERWPRATWWTQGSDSRRLHIGGSTETEGIVLGAVATDQGILTVGVAYPPDVDGGDGVVWDLSHR